MTTPARRTKFAPPDGNLNGLRTGAAASGRNLPTWEQTRQDVAAIIDESPWLAPADHLLLEVFTEELAVYRHAAKALQRLTPTATNKKLSAQKLQIRRARVIGELADRLGLSPQSRYRIGLTVAQTQKAMHRVEPLRSEDRARAVAEILADARALPTPDDAEVVSDAGDAEEPLDETPDLRAAEED